MNEEDYSYTDRLEDALSYVDHHGYGVAPDIDAVIEQAARDYLDQLQLNGE